jgi:rubredoxin
MKTWLRCKACGYVLQEKELGDVCPACGVPRKMFEPYQHPVSEERRRILDLHLHPVAVHAPQALTFFLLLLTALFLAVGGPLQADLAAAIRILSICLPVTIAAAAAAGVIDARVRFHRVTTPLLKKKIALAVVFGAGSLALPPAVYFLPIGAPAAAGTLLFLEGVLLACSAILGMIGSRLLDARFPG